MLRFFGFFFVFVFVFRFVSAFKESRVLLEYETHYLLQYSLGNSFKMLT